MMTVLTSGARPPGHVEADALHRHDPPLDGRARRDVGGDASARARPRRSAAGGGSTPRARRGRRGRAPASASCERLGRARAAGRAARRRTSRPRRARPRRRGRARRRRSGRTAASACSTSTSARGTASRYPSVWSRRSSRLSTPKSRSRDGLASQRVPLPRGARPATAGHGRSRHRPGGVHVVVRRRVGRTARRRRDRSRRPPADCWR